jgi:glycine/D-amino acid oxidase-like deaminating enzyme
MGYKRSVKALPQSADVVIVGAGFAGAATAWALARRGVTNVLVLEREVGLGRYASGRSAGLGRQIADDDHTTALTVRGAQLIREMPVWQSSGGLYSFDDAAHADAYAERAKRFAIAAVMGSPDELIAPGWPQLSQLRSVRVMHVPSDGTIDVAALLGVLTQNLRIELGCPVQRLDGPTVMTPRGAIAARVVVDASGAWAGELVGEPLQAFKRHVFVLDDDAAPPTPWLWHLGAGEMYMRRDANGVIASPCDSALCPAGHQDPDLVGEAHLRKLLDEADSMLAGAPITRRWACQRAFTEDRKMKLGRDPNKPWLVWAAGLGGHGATAAPAVGERVANAVIETLSS